MDLDRVCVSRPGADLTADLTVVERERIADALRARLAPNTLTSYARAWRRWENWCDRRGTSAMPATPAHIAAWVTELGAAGRSMATVETALAAIRHAHLEAGLADPTASPGVVAVRAGLRRQVGVAPGRQSHPLSVDELRLVLSGIDPATTRGARDRALLLLGFAAALRRSELAELTVADLTWRRDGLVVRIRSSKADQTAVGAVVGVVRGNHNETDPVAAVKAWVLDDDSAATDPLFSAVSWSDRRSRRPLSGRAVGRIVQARADAVGLGELGVSGHSLRAGHATAAALAGMPVDRIARTTRHASLSALARYIRPAQVLDDTTSGSLGL